MEFTKEQRAVVEAPPGTWLVSAAAGSGKTTVLTERIVRRVLDADADIRRLLVMTFTEAAAINMRRKIGSLLREQQATATDSVRRAWLARQAASLPRASISTIHSFCLDVLRSFQYLLQDEEGEPLVEPGSSVLDPASADLLFADALDRVLSAYYRFCDRVADEGDVAAAEELPTGLPRRGARPAPFVFGDVPERADAWVATFQTLCDGYSPGRDDQALRGLVVSLHRFLRSMPDYEQWADCALRRLEEAALDFGSSPWAETLIRQAELLLQRAGEAIPDLLHRLEEGVCFVKDAKKNASYIADYRALLSEVDSIADEIRTMRAADRVPAWDVLVELAARIPDVSPSSRARDEETAAFVDAFLRRIPEVVHLLTGRYHTPKYRNHFEFDTVPLFLRNAASIGKDIADTVAPMRRLVEIVLLSDRVYTSLKRQERGIDFSDFEHYALRILRTREAQTYYRERYREVYIDECQDTSSIQDEIVAGVAGDNVFMVGDVKQSIYRFRHANPTRFLDRSRRFARGDGGQLAGIGRNFRSTEGILAAVNRLFRQVMTEKAGEIDYEDGHALTPADEAEPGCPVTLLLVDTNRTGSPGAEEDGADADENEERVLPEEAGESAEEEPERDDLEGLAIAKRIRALLDQGVRPDEIAVLGRTHWVCKHVAAALDESKISHTLTDSQGFLATPELMLLDALVSLLDNAAQDIPLSAVMRSRLHGDATRPGEGRAQGFSEADLLRIRVDSDAAVQPGEPSRTFFHEAVAWYAQQGQDDGLRDAVSGFLLWLDGIRAREPHLRLTELFASVFERSGYLEYVSQLPDGMRRAEEISLFTQWAEAFESSGARGLHRFANHLAALREAGAEESPFAVGQSPEGRIRILTIHGSKGLEFGHVFVAGCGRRLAAGHREKLLFSEREGLGPLYVDIARSVTRHTYVRLAMERSLRNADLAEEMRLLYVAMTRAARSLVLVAGVPLDPEKGVPALARRVRDARIAGGVNWPLPPHLSLAAGSFLDWILLSMARDGQIDWTPIAGAADPEGLLTGEGIPMSEDAASSQLEAGRIRLELHRPEQWTDQDGGAREDAAMVPVPHNDLEQAAPDLSAKPFALLTGPLDPEVFDPETYWAAREVFGRLLLTRYRYPAAASSAAKISVSELKRREQRYAQTWDQAGEESMPEEAPWLQGTGLEVRPFGEKNAVGGADGGLTGAERGSAIHAVLRYLDLSEAVRHPGPDEILRQIARMRDHAMLTPAEAVTVEPLAVRFSRFADSELGRRLQSAEASGRVYREMPFTLRFDAAAIHRELDAAAFAPEDATLVQGIIDLWFEEPGREGVILVDFKSDRIRGTDAEIARILGDRYRIQLDYYEMAIVRSTGKQVRSRYIWLFDAEKAYEIERNGTFSTPPSQTQIP